MDLLELRKRVEEYDIYLNIWLLDNSFHKICHANMYRFNLIKADFQVDWMTTQLNSFQNMLIRSRGGEHVLLFKIGLVCPTGATGDD